MNLEISMGGTQGESFAPMEQTWRNEGLSVGEDHMRLYGEEIQMEVNFSDLILGDRLGQGACSAVNLARHRRTGEKFAIKMFNTYDKGQASQLFNEILLLTSFQCDALISLKGAFHDEGAIGVIIEYMDRGSLEGLMKNHIELTEPVMSAISFQIIWGLGYLHYEKQIHRDIKPGNILINSFGQVKLSDFGISKELDNSVAMSMTSVGTYRYMSPERLRGDKYDGTADIWSVGITIVELWNKKYPFSHVADTPISLLGELENLDFPRFLSRIGDFSRPMTEFLLGLLDVEPSQRITSERLMGNEWFEKNDVRCLVDAHAIVEPWIHDMDSRAHHDSGPSNQSQRKPPMFMSASRGGSFKKDINEMSISIDSTRGGEDGLNVSRGISNNPYTSSGHLNASMSTAERYRSAFGIGQTPDEYEDEQFEDDVEPYNGHNDFKGEEKKSEYYRRK